MSYGLASIIITFIVGFVFGALSCYFTYKLKAEPKRILTYVVTTIYTISILSEILLEAYTVHVALHGIMGLVVGFYFEGKWINKNK